MYVNSGNFTDQPRPATAGRAAEGITVATLHDPSPKIDHYQYQACSVVAAPSVLFVHQSSMTRRLRVAFNLSIHNVVLKSVVYNKSIDLSLVNLQLIGLQYLQNKQTKMVNSVADD